MISLELSGSGWGRLVFSLEDLMEKVRLISPMVMHDILHT